ncbi:conserved hypothetical protein, partial [Ricinus communis]
MRAKISFEPPGGYGTTTVMGLDGHVSAAMARGEAKAAQAAAMASSARVPRRWMVSVKVVSVFLLCSCGGDLCRHQPQPAADRHDLAGPAHERAVDHLAVDHIGADAPFLGIAGGLDHAQGVGKLGVGRPEHVVRQRDLAGMDAALADEAELARHLAFRAEAVRVADIGEHGVVGKDVRLGRGHAHREHRRGHRRRVAAVDAERLEQVAQPKLQPGHARVRRGQFRRAAQGGRRLDVQQQPDRGVGSREA